MSVPARLKRLEQLVLAQRDMSVEALLDLLLCFCQEASRGPLRGDKHVRDFLDWGESRARSRSTQSGPGSAWGQVVCSTCV